MNPNGRLAVYANTNGIFYGSKIVDELNNIIVKEQQKGVDEVFIKLKVPEVSVFPNSMLKVSLEETVRGEDAFLVQWFPNPPGVEVSKLNSSRNKDEFFHSIAALFQAGVKRLTFVNPYVFDQRKDTLEGRDTVGAALFCQQLSGVTNRERMQALCLDIHAQQIVGFYQMININLISVPVFQTYVDFIKNNYSSILNNAVWILPDAGASKRGRVYSDLTGLSTVMVDKRRISPTEVQMIAFASEGLDLKGKTGLLTDDILASGSTAGKAVAFLKNEKGLLESYWLITHPEITNIKELDKMYDKGLFKKIFIADTIKLPDRDYFIQVPTSQLMARIIYNIHTDQSIRKYLQVKAELNTNNQIV